MIEQMDIIKKVLMHRSRVSVKLSSIANDIAARGRRHDNSYTGGTEMNLLIKIANEKDANKKLELKKVLKGIHTNNNDYIPDFHDNGISGMNMIELLEFIADKISEYDLMVINDNAPNDLDAYHKYVINGLTLSSDLSSVIKETIMYFINRNESIRKSLPKSAKELAAEELDKLEGEENGTVKEE